MSYLLFFLSIGLITALALVIKKSQKLKSDYAISQQKLKELNKKLQGANRKYGGLISKEDAIREIDSKISIGKTEEKELSTKITALRERLQGLEEQEFFEEFGFYESKYDFQEAVEYKQTLDEIRSQQKQIIKAKQAAICHTQWTVQGSEKEGKKMTDNFIKLVLRTFNGECDASILKVKYNNVTTMENRIRKAYEDLNKLSQSTKVQIALQYFDLKLKELWLTHEYQEKKQQEQEEQRRIREQMREEEKAARERERATKEAEKEEQRYQEALEKARKDVESSTGQARQKLENKIEELKRQLAEAEANKQRAISQAQQTKSGHVYVISNIGSFGENVYKIGMTRRLEPMDRVKELGDASVPFPFDVHAMIFCEDAPALESSLHKYFHDGRMNKINDRKEFFRISLDQIVKAVEQIDQELNTCKSEVTFTKVAEASEYRKTLAQERKR